jgi:hypothetical protein
VSAAPAVTFFLGIIIGACVAVILCSFMGVV